MNPRGGDSHHNLFHNTNVWEPHASGNGESGMKMASIHVEPHLLFFSFFFFVVAPHRDTVTSNEWCPGPATGDAARWPVQMQGVPRARQALEGSTNHSFLSCWEEPEEHRYTLRQQRKSPQTGLLPGNHHVPRSRCCGHWCRELGGPLASQWRCHRCGVGTLARARAS